MEKQEKIGIKKIAVVLLAFIVTFGMCGTFTNTDSFASSKTPAQVKSLKAVAQSSTKAKLTWGKAKYAKKYQVYKKVSGGKYKLVKTTNTRSYISIQTPGKKYYYKVRGINGKQKGKYSTVKSLTIKKYKNGDVVPSKYATKVDKYSMKYVESDEAYVLSFATFLDDGKTSVKTSGTVTATITDNGEHKLYGPDKLSFTSNKYVKEIQSGKTYYLCKLKIPRSDLLGGTTATGAGAFQIVFADGHKSKHLNFQLNNLPIISMPDVGAKVKLGTSDKTFYVTKVNGTQIEVLDQDEADVPFDDNRDKTIFNNGESYLAYAGSDIDTYLNGAYYNALPADVKEKIVKQNISQSAYEWDETNPPRITETAVGERNVYLLDMDDVINLSAEERAAMFPDEDCWLRSANTSYNNTACDVDGDDGSFDCMYCGNYGAYAAFTIDVIGLDLEILE